MLGLSNIFEMTILEQFLNKTPSFNKDELGALIKRNAKLAGFFLLNDKFGSTEDQIKADYE